MFGIVAKAFLSLFKKVCNYGHWLDVCTSLIVVAAGIDTRYITMLFLAVAMDLVTVIMSY